MQQTTEKRRPASARTNTRRPPRASSGSKPWFVGGRIDLPFLLLTLLLTVMGLVMLFSASFPSANYETGDPTFYLKRQGLFALLGLAAMVVMSRMNYQKLRRYSVLLVGISLFLLLLVLVPGLGINENGATRWLGKKGVLTFQPSEIAKLAVIVFFADSISKKKNLMETFKYGIRPYLLLLAFYAVLMLLEPHLSGTILIVGTGVVLMIVGGINKKWAIGGIGAVAAVGFAYVKLVETGVISYGASRIEMWKNPFIDPLKAGYQLSQSLITIGSGGLTGVGLGNSTQKYLYLTYGDSDFIFSIIGEEIGFIGIVAMLAVYALLMVRGLRCAWYAQDTYGLMMATGIISTIAIQLLINVAVCTSSMPPTGLPLPFISSGGSSIVIFMAETGILLNVSRFSRQT